MEYIPLASHPLKVSKLCLGTMMFGEKCDEAASQAIVKTALDSGVNFFDTAAMYSAGVCETYLGKALAGVPRETVFVTTKVVKGIDRQSILESIDESLLRLQMDYVDLYLVHWPVAGMDITEMMSALNEVVASGKTRLVGCCNFPAYLLASANRIAAEHGWARLTNNQVAYNLIERGIEVEILPQALLEGIAITAYRPLAIGLLTGRYRPGTPLDAAGRGALDSRVITWLSQHGGAVERFIDFASALGVEPAQLAIAWVNYSPAITAPIAGVSSVNQLASSLKGFEIRLSETEYRAVSQIFDTEVKEEGLQLFPGLKYNFPRLRRKLFLAHS
jgi:aryl-alcohol dehydrogenase-like predicted oxidoreductase